MMHVLNRGALTLLACVGLAVGVHAQSTTPGSQPGSSPSQPGTSPSQPGNRQGTPMTTQPGQQDRNNSLHNQNDPNMSGRRMTLADADLRTHTSLTGTDVVGLNDDAIGDVEDLLIDRGSGRVQYAIVTTGTTLGMGGRTIAVPFQGLRWDAAREKFTCSKTAEQLRQYPQWTEKDWSGLVSTSRPSDVDTIDDPNRTGSPTNITSQPGNSTTNSGNNNPNTNPGNTTGTPGNTGSPTRDTAHSPNNPGRPADPATGTGLARNGDGQSFRDYYYSQEGRRSQYWDPYHSNLDTSTQKSITGEVTSVERRSRSGSGEQTVVTIREQGGQEHRVALGPAWYMSGVDSAPRRGDQITVQAWNTRSMAGNTGTGTGTGNAGTGGANSNTTANNNNQNTDPTHRTGSGMSGSMDRDVTLVASSYRLNNQDVRLRENQSTSWSRRAYESEGRWYSQPYARHILGSTLDGAKIECRNTACGSVDEVIVDVNSGRVAFLSIDPDRNFLGIGDTKYLVPWSVVSVGLDNTVRVDTTKDMMLAGQRTPSDLKELRNSAYTDQIYRAYGVSVPDDWSREADSATGTGLPRDDMDRNRDMDRDRDRDTDRDRDNRPK